MCDLLLPRDIKELSACSLFLVKITLTKKA